MVYTTRSKLPTVHTGSTTIPEDRLKFLTVMGPRSLGDSRSSNMQRQRSGNLEKYEALMVETKNTMARNAEVLADHTAKICDREDGVVAKGGC